MQIQCSNCQKEFNVPEEKLPQSSKFNFKCPSCKAKTQIDLSGRETPGQNEQDPLEADPLNEPDYFPPGSSTALVCTLDKELEQKVQAYMESKGCYVTTAPSRDLAVSKARLNRYNLVFVQENEIFAPLLEEINTWPGSIRAETNVILMGEKAPSFHQHQAFLQAVNFYLNSEDREKLEDFLHLCLREYEMGKELWNKAKEDLQYA